MKDQVDILIIDSDPITGKLLFEIAATKYKVQLATLGSEGIELFKRLKPMIVLVDLNLPDKSGFEICKEIRFLFPERLVYLIALSTEELPDTKGKAYAAGANDFITKPINSFEIIAKLNTFFKLGHYSQSFDHFSFAEFIKKSSALLKTVNRLQDDYDKIIALEAKSPDIIVHMHDGSTWETRCSLKSFIQLFPKNLLIRIHKTFAVNIRYFNGVTTQDGHWMAKVHAPNHDLTLPISRKHLSLLKNLSTLKDQGESLNEMDFNLMQKVESM